MRASFAAFTIAGEIGSTLKLNSLTAAQFALFHPRKDEYLQTEMELHGSTGCGFSLCSSYYSISCSIFSDSL